MSTSIIGLHHVTAIASDPQRTLDFYIEVMGLRLVKRTVNFDDPETYHLYFGNDIGSPGTILTFFPWVGAARGYVGIGEVSAIAFSVPLASLEFWEKRLLRFGIPAERAGKRFGDPVIRLSDPDGMHLEIIAHNHSGGFHPSRTSDVPAQHAIRGFYGVTLCERRHEPTASVLEAMGFYKAAEEGDRIRFTAGGGTIGNTIDLLMLPQSAHGRLGAGSVHHIAFRVPDDASQIKWREKLSAISLNVTDVLNRIYFHSIYFREPGGVLFELATDPPGFTFDESLDALGENLKLPPWLEERRLALAGELPAIELPYRKVERLHE